jgi:hypothetical protein
VVKDEILHCVQNDKVGLVAQFYSVNDHFLEILHCVQDDRKGLSHSNSTLSLLT